MASSLGRFEDWRRAVCGGRLFEVEVDSEKIFFLLQTDGLSIERTRRGLEGTNV